MTVPSTPDGAGTPAPSGPALILSEERLAVSTVRVPDRRVRLEKFVVSETRTVTVRLDREEYRLVEMPVDDDAPSAPQDDPHRWLTLSEERVVVTTEVVPVARVRLAVATVSTDRDVTGDVRRDVLDDAPAVTPGASPRPGS